MSTKVPKPLGKEDKNSSQIIKNSPSLTKKEMEVSIKIIDFNLWWNTSALFYPKIF